MRRAIILLTLLTLVGCQRLEKAERTVEPISVKTERTREGEMPEEFVAIGQIRALHRATVSAQTEGLVDQVGPELGDRVQQGEPLIWLRQTMGEMQIKEQEADVETARARVGEQQVSVRLAQQNMINDVARAKESVTQAEIAVTQAQTELDSAKNDLDRKTGLLEEKAIAETQVEKARLQWELAKDGLRTADSKLNSARSDFTLANNGTTKIDLQRAQLRSAETELSRAQATLATSRSGLEQSVIKAPISGVVTTREVSPGQTVGPGQGALITIVDNSRLEVQAQIDQHYAPLLRRGLKASLLSQLYPAKRWTVSLREVVPSSNPETATLGARFEFQDQAPEMVDGMTVQLRLNLGHKQGVLVPLQALIPSKLGQHILLVVDGKSVPRAINPIATNESHLLLESGSIPVGELVIVDGLDSLVETPVRHAEIKNHLDENTR